MSLLLFFLTRKVKLSWKRFWKKWNLFESWSAVRKKELPNLRSICLKWTSNGPWSPFPFYSGYPIGQVGGTRHCQSPWQRSVWSLPWKDSNQHSKMIFCFLFCNPQNLFILQPFGKLEMPSVSQNLSCSAFYSVSLQIVLQRLCFIWCSWKVLSFCFVFLIKIVTKQIASWSSYMNLMSSKFEVAIGIAVPLSPFWVAKFNEFCTSLTVFD